jgi:hypothetical protein
MTSRRRIDVTEDARLAGLRAVGYHGPVDPAFTPAHCEPVLVDAEERLTRVLDFVHGARELEAEVESVDPPLPATGDLPGVATRIGPFPAIVDGVVAVVGESERQLADDIDPFKCAFPWRVSHFLSWLRDDARPNSAFCGRAGEGLWACYLTKLERHALWKAFNPAIYLRLREAVREGDPEKMISTAFWLARVVVEPRSDLFKAAEALHRAGSPRYRYILEERLGLKDEASWEGGLKEAAYAFDAPREAPPRPQVRHSAREKMRQGATHR